MLRYSDLSLPWKRIFELEWESICEGSKAIAAVIVNENGEIISEGRNQISECNVPNPATAHAEAEAIRNLDVRKHPNPKTYTLYAGLEPCIMCMGTLVMGHIRNVVIAARDDYGGAMNLIQHSSFAKSKGIKITWLDNELGDMQRAFQTIRELLYNQEEEKRERMLQDFSVYNEKGVNAAVKLMERGFFEGCALNEITAAEVFDALMEIEERVG
ncbi:MAG: nucleoside deaminase [Lachnospiraceae bacterium]|nr:nucleoside deaminase [Lachnospiraceae bacterium]